MWKEIVCDGGYFPDYVVNEYGTVVRKRDGLVMKQYVQKSGYVAVYLKDTMGHTCIRMVHRIVAYAFLPMVRGKEYVDHINTIRHDNRAANLRWVTPKENANNEMTKIKRKKRREK